MTTREAIEAKCNELRAYGEIIEMIESRIRWYQHEDDENPEVLIDDEGDWSAANLKALREVLAKVEKMANI